MAAGTIAFSRTASPLHDRPRVRRIEHLDPYLLISTLLLIAYGIVMTYSVTIEDRAFSGDIIQPMSRAFLYALIGIAVMCVAAFVDYAWLGTFAPVLYLVALGVLAVVLVIGTTTLGATRWVQLAGFKFQPSEFAKVLMIIVLAKWFADRAGRMGSPLVIGGALAILAPAAGLVFRQPDLGTSLVFVAIFFGMAFLAGARPWQLTALVAASVAALPVAWGVLKDYQRARLTVFLDPYADPQGAGWNIIQSLIAVGSGQLTGKGLTAGTQSPLGYLPIAESDFIFAGLAEDLGYVGALILFALYAILLLSALRIAARARDAFGGLLAGGVVAMIGFQIAVNVGMAISLMPVTGIPLPFISQGGSSLISTCAALGILQSVAMRREDAYVRT
ncbi:MAG TPA: rod shape-determining protein RodA [Candidatus Limnocylindria bacterium]|nr:rod shape-determining protein RodA [Candidatus Limnocylindria bacterium]